MQWVIKNIIFNKPWIFLLLYKMIEQNGTNFFIHDLCIIFEETQKITFKFDANLINDTSFDWKSIEKKIEGGGEN